MTSHQPEIDFTDVLQRKENTPDNTRHLAENLDQFNAECKKVYSILLQGVRLTTMTAPQYHIGELRARVRDLIKKGIPVQKQWIKDSEGKRTKFKEYFIER